MTPSPSIMESLFQRSLDDLIKSLRSSAPPSVTISRSMEEIRRELRSVDHSTKAIALQKLTYLSALHGVDMSFAAFHGVELLSSPRFAHKKIAYLAASLSFRPDTSVLLLLPNQLRKDLSSPSPFESSLALEFLSVASTPDLARELTTDIFSLLSSAKTHARKRAICVIGRFFSQYPESIRVALKRLVENLECSDQVSASATIGVFLELATGDPISYLPLAPEFYRLLVDSKNNWVLIKVVKIFAKLAPLEPRLAKRVVDPVCEHMSQSRAKSLVFECVRMVVSSLTDYESAVKLAVEKIHEFLVDEDANLRYLGLSSLLVLRKTHLWAVIENKEEIIKSLSDFDPNIRSEALHLVMDMISEDSVAEITRILMNYALKSEPDFCNEIFGSILSTCGRNVYEIIVDFDWYISILEDMSRNPHCITGVEIGRQIIDIGLRVQDARPQLVRICRELLIDPTLLGNPLLHPTLSAAAWISGEYIEYSKNPFELIEALLQPRTNLLPSSARAVYVQSAFKVLAFSLHLYYTNNSVVSSFTGDSLPGVSHSFSYAQCLDDPKLEECEVPHSRFDKASVGSDAIEIGCNLVTLATGDHERYSCESIVHLINLIKMAMESLSECNGVELEERARNVIGLIHALQEIPDFLIDEDIKYKSKDPKASEIVQMMLDAFSEKLGPVPMNAQERVPLPDGLELIENLSELDVVLGDVLPPSPSFSLHGLSETGIVPHFSLRSQKELEHTSEPTSLLSEHRKRHGLYYLPVEKNETDLDHYLPPSFDDSQALANLVDAARNIEKRNEISKTRSKPRPVVVKLDEDEASSSSVKAARDSKDGIVSIVVQDVLLGDGGKRTLSQKIPFDYSSSVKGVEVLLKSDSFSAQCKEYSGDILTSQQGSSSSRRSKHHNHRKETSKISKGKKVKGESSQKSSHRKHSEVVHHDLRNKTQQRAEVIQDVVPQTPVIQDFLL